MSSNQDAEKVLSELSAILEQEHDALVSGRAGTAGALLQSKMEAMKAFDALMEDPVRVRGVADFKTRMERIITLANENAALFSAVRNGLSSVITRVSAPSSSAYVGAYTSTGGKTAFSQASGGYAKKA